MTSPPLFRSVPGSLLIAGEYLVTEPGGPGLALAAGGRAVMKIEESSTLTMVGIAGDRGPVSGDLADHVLRACLDSGSLTAPPRCRLTVDTGTFHGPDGRKLGFGSSAAAAVLLASGLLDGVCGRSSSTTDDEVIHHALRAHRAWQGGRGSGYDILCSVRGGCGAVTGGLEPAWRVLKWPSHLSAWLLRGPDAVRSGSAVARYEAWKTGHSGTDPENLRTRISAKVSGLCSLLTPGAAAAGFPDRIHELAVLGALLGERIGVPALPRLPPQFDGGCDVWHRPGLAAAKCLGAGDETVLVVAVPDGLRLTERSALEELTRIGSARCLTVEPDGLRTDEFR